MVVNEGLFFEALFCFTKSVLAVFLSLLLISCSGWPGEVERNISLYRHGDSLSQFMDQESVLNLLEVSESRYVDLKVAGAEYCYPGRMRTIKKMHRLVKYEIDGGLYSDAGLNLLRSFYALGETRGLMEKMAEEGGCIIDYALGLVRKKDLVFYSRESILGLKDWTNPDEIQELMKREHWTNPDEIQELMKREHW